MCYIMANANFNKVLDENNVNYALTWRSDNYFVFKLHDRTSVFLNKITKKLGDEDWFEMATGCLYAGLWDMAEYSVAGKTMLGFVNEDMMHNLTKDEQAAYFEKKYESLSSWLSEVMDIPTLREGWPVILYLAEQNKMNLKQFLKSFEGGNENE